MRYPGATDSDLDTVLQDASQRDRQTFPDELTWYAFPETWGSTALGFGGMGGQMITTAQTYIVIHGNHGFVYYGARFFKKVDRGVAYRMIFAISTTRYR